MTAKKVILILSSLLMCLTIATPYADAQTSRIDPVHVRDSRTNASGTGARFFTIYGCKTITAGHILSVHGTPIITPLKTATDEAIVEYFDKDADDVAIIRQNHVKKDDCPHFPSSQEINQVLLSGLDRRMLTMNSADELIISSIDVKKITGG